MYASPDTNKNIFQIVTYPIASVDNMKWLQCTYCVELSYIIIQIWRVKGGLHTFLSAGILILSSPLGLLTGRIY